MLDFFLLSPPHRDPGVRSVEPLGLGKRNLDMRGLSLEQSIKRGRSVHSATWLRILFVSRLQGIPMGMNLNCLKCFLFVVSAFNTNNRWHGSCMIYPPTIFESQFRALAAVDHDMMMIFVHLRSDAIWNSTALHARPSCKSSAWKPFKPPLPRLKALPERVNLLLK